MPPGTPFPSGHSQIAVGTYGGLALCRREKWVRIVGTVLAVLIPFSRMYLGVHTPADVLVGSLCALVLAAALWVPFFPRGDCSTTDGSGACRNGDARTCPTRICQLLPLSV